MELFDIKHVNVAIYLKRGIQHDSGISDELFLDVFQQYNILS